jgi:hypothetical protein
MPPFEMPERTVTMGFDDGSLKGLEVDVKIDLSLDGFLELGALFDKATDKDTGWEPVKDLFTWFADNVVLGWNLQRNGEPVPCNPTAFTSTMSAKNGLALVTRYLQTVRGADVPLSQPSRNGRTSKVPLGSRSRRS